MIYCDLLVLVIILVFCRYDVISGLATWPGFVLMTLFVHIWYAELTSWLGIVTVCTSFCRWYSKGCPYWLSYGFQYVQCSKENPYWLFLVLRSNVAREILTDWFNLYVKCSMGNPYWFFYRVTVQCSKGYPYWLDWL